MLIQSKATQAPSLRRSRLSSIARGANLFLVAILTGSLVDQWLVEARVFDGYSPSRWIAVHQEMFAAHGLSMPVLGSLTALSFVALVVLGGVWRSRRAQLTTIALVLTVALGLISATVNIPINIEVNSWNPALVPADFADIRDSWVLFHGVRTVLMLGALAAVIAAALDRRPASSQA